MLIMRSRPGIFIALITGMVAIPSVIGFAVIQGSKQAQSSVTEQTRLYEERKQQQTSVAQQQVEQKREQQQVTNQVEGPSQPDEAITPSSVTVFFSKTPESNEDPSKVYPVDRQFRSEEGTITHSGLSAVIAGPTAEEKAQGYFGGILLTGDSKHDGQDFGLTVEQDTARFQFLREKENRGSVEDSRERSQLTATIQYLTGATRVILLDQDGNCLYESGGQNACLR